MSEILPEITVKQKGLYVSMIFVCQTIEEADALYAELKYRITNKDKSQLKVMIDADNTEIVSDGRAADA